MKNFKRIGYTLLILSYFIVVLAFIYTNSFDLEYNKRQLFIGISILIIVSMWLFSGFLLSKETAEKKEDKFTVILKVIAHLPLYLILFPIFIVPALIQLISDSFRNKVKPLLKSGFELKNEKVEKKKIYNLSKGNIVIKVREFELYEISEDAGATFNPIEQSKVFTLEERGEFKEYLFQYYGSDYRDKDFYDPTRKLVSLLMQNKIVGIENTKK